MKPEHKDHLKGYGPMYSIILLLLGGGGVATLSDNIPVTSKQFLAWTTTHTATPHKVSEEAINQINDVLGAIQLEQTRNQLRQAYADKCVASGDALTYIDREIDRLEGIYFKLTKREYDPPPCPV